jgi:hypothetical protein
MIFTFRSTRQLDQIILCPLLHFVRGFFGDITGDKWIAAMR